MQALPRPSRSSRPPLVGTATAASTTRERLHAQQRQGTLSDGHLWRGGPGAKQPVHAAGADAAGGRPARGALRFAEVGEGLAGPPQPRLLELLAGHVAQLREAPEVGGQLRWRRLLHSVEDRGVQGPQVPLPWQVVQLHAGPQQVREVLGIYVGEGRHSAAHPGYGPLDKVLARVGAKLAVEPQHVRQTPRPEAGQVPGRLRGQRLQQRVRQP
mmetsp:Transcript_34717/g.99375  ORF Transcript_34717/g.99375 Transcript_34717/m.99375 type:complete len:213 (+) Transcript_34717:50-688(+)